MTGWAGGKEGGLTDSVIVPRPPLAALPGEIEAAARGKEVHEGKKITRLVNGAPALGRSERGAEAIAEARSAEAEIHG